MSNESFVWTDALRLEFANLLIGEYFSLDVQTAMDKFKQSKTPKKERIVITQYSNINIPEEKFPAIKAALERVLNDEGGPYEVYNITEIPKLIREAERRAWYAARHPQFSQMQFQDYKGSIK